MTANALEADAREGIAAFLGKRRPVWRGSILSRRRTAERIGRLKLHVEGPQPLGMRGHKRARAMGLKTSPTPGMRDPTKRDRAYATARGLAYGGPSCDFQRRGEPPAAAVEIQRPRDVFYTADALCGRSSWSSHCSPVWPSPSFGTASSRTPGGSRSRWTIRTSRRWRDPTTTTRPRSSSRSRRAGLTSLAVTRGARREHRRRRPGVRDHRRGAAQSGALWRPIEDPLLAALVRSKRIDAGRGLLCSSPIRPTYLPLPLAAGACTSARERPRAARLAPWLIEVRTQIDYFNTWRSAFRPIRSPWRTGSACC